MPNRDLLVLAKNGTNIEKELAIIEAVLFSVENMTAFCLATEMIDLNKYKVINSPHLIEQFIQTRKKKPFVFLYNKN